MDKVTVKAPANIAFIKYWGKKNEKLRLPANSSISMNLSETYTLTSVEKDKTLQTDRVSIDGTRLNGEALIRITKHLDLIRGMAKEKMFLRIESKNNFPRGAGIASSASGFAALTLAASKAFELNLSEKELSILARLGSGSACRSIPDGFVEWKVGETSESSYAHSLYPPDYWEICDLIAIVGEDSKKVSSTEGHSIAESSPFYKARIAGMPKKISEIKKAMKNKDFAKFGEIIETEAVNMHTVMMTSKPPLFYWLPETVTIMESVIQWRGQGIQSYFTIDAGPNVHVICESKNTDKLKIKLKSMHEIKKVFINKPSIGATLI